MKAGIIHLTDIHFSEKGNWIEDKITNIISAIRQDFKETNHIYFIVTGDVANKGKATEYLIAETFLHKLKTSAERFLEDKKFKFVIVPGNHDCNFEYDNQSRRNDINGMNYNKIGEDDSVIDSSMAVQKDFWDFYEKFNSPPESRLTFQVEDSIESKTICFTCYNTAWMSEMEEKTGTLFFPVKLIEKKKIPKADGVNIALFHHPLSWFNPNTTNNNRKEFKKHLEENSSILFYGHEHEDEHLKNQDIGSKQETVYISGNSLQTGNTGASGFQTVVIDIDKKNGVVKSYVWKKSMYVSDSEKHFIIDGCDYRHKDFIHDGDFIKKLSALSLPLKFETKEKIDLQDIYVFPDLEKLSTEEKKLDDGYIDSEKLIKKEDLRTIILEGESQSGKSSLLSMLYLRFVDSGKYPLYIDAKEFKNLDFEKTFKRCFGNQYKNGEQTFEAFKQYDLNDTVLLIDNLHELKFNSKTIVNIIKECQLRFTKIVIITGSIYGHLSTIKSEFKDIEFYTLKSLGFKKRNELIERYHKLNESPLTVTSQTILDKTKHTFDQVQLVLGNKLIPAYPVYVLSIIQSLNYATPYNLEQTSLGYCYQTLIYIALANKAKIPNEDIDSYFNFLTEFAYNLNEQSIRVFNDDNLNSFFKLYSEKFVAKPINEIKNNLFLSNIFVEDEDGFYKFGYDYIFYFLVAKKIAEIINTKAGQKIVKELCENLHNEKNANILVLTAHHTKDNYLIDEATFASMVPFNNLKPITLKLDDEFYNLIEGIVKTISTDILNSEKNPNEERKKTLTASDKVERALDNEKNPIVEDVETNEKLQAMFQSLRAIEIVGQIVKNRKGSIDKEKLTGIIIELYNTAFRTITFFGQTFEEGKVDYVTALRERVEDGDSRKEIEGKVSSFFQYVSFQACLTMFSRLVYSVGNKDLKSLFDDVASKMNTPAAKLVTFSIKTYYDKLSTKELAALANEFSNNPVALSILKARTRNYVYNNHIDYKKKQKIAAAVYMKIQQKPNPNKTSQPF